MDDNKVIYLDKDKGVNAHMTFCVRCITAHGKKLDAVKKEDRPNDGPELVMMGNRGYVLTCGHCGFEHYGGLNTGQKTCIKCGSNYLNKRVLDEWERVPSANLCTSCQKEVDDANEYARKVVEAGGIYWKCDTCKKQGVIQGSNPIAAEVREKMNLPAPEPCGLTIEKDECPFCREN